MLMHSLEPENIKRIMEKAISSHAFLVSLLCLVGIAVFSCQSHTDNKRKNGSQKTKLIIATAANAQFAMQEIKEMYEAKQDSIAVDLIISSSGKLTAQIQQGAPYDVFLSADMKYPEYLFSKGLAQTAPQIYAQGGLIVWSTTLQLDSSNWVDALKKAAKVAIANPNLAPYGQQAAKAFEYLQIKEDLKDKLVFGESVSQTNQYILIGACEIGLTAKSVVFSPNVKQKGSWQNIPADAYEPIQQGLIITKYGSQSHPSQTKAFVDYLFSDAAKEILEKYGYIVR
jgi:molybdate transport system substrate-binding protein